MLASDAGAATEPTASGPRILLVDDEPSILRALTRALGLLRPTWSVRVADSGAGALRYMQSARCDLLVTDLEMPGIDGIALLTQAKRDFPAVIRLVHSSHIEHGDELSTLAHAAVPKPALPKDLIRTIERALSGAPSAAA